MNGPPVVVRLVCDEFVIDPVDPTAFSGDEVGTRIRARAHWVLNPLGEAMLMDKLAEAAVEEERVRGASNGG